MRLETPPLAHATVWIQRTIKHFFAITRATTAISPSFPGPALLSMPLLTFQNRGCEPPPQGKGPELKDHMRQARHRLTGPHMVKAGLSMLTALQEVPEKWLLMVPAVSFCKWGKLRPGKRECLSGIFALGLDSPHQACLGHLQGQQVGGGGSGSRQK